MKRSTQRRAAVRQDRSEGLDDDDVRALLATLGRMSRASRREMREFGDVIARSKAAHLTYRHMVAAQHVFLHEPLSVGELAERLDVAPTTASLVATELERAGMIERERDPVDGRRVLLRVNPELARFIVERRIAPMRRMMATLDAEERAALIKALGLYVNEIELRAP